MRFAVSLRRKLFLLALVIAPAMAWGAPQPPRPATATVQQQRATAVAKDRAAAKLAASRGGTTVLKVAPGTAEVVSAARTLFGNMIGPAAMLSGGLVPLGFLADPIPDHTPILHKLKCVYYFLSVASLANNLVAIMYATVACNKLTETVVTVAAPSAFALIKRDYELAWVGCNVHFMGGLFGFVGMILIRAYTLFPESLNQAAAGLGGAALLTMLSIVNVGISQGDGAGHVFGGNLLTLSVRYLWLLSKNVFQSKGLVAFAALGLGLVSAGAAGKNLFMPETYQPGMKQK